MRMMESSVKTGFRRAHLLLLLLVFLLGALFLWYSLDTHPELHSRVDVLNTSQPMNVLVSVQGTALDPGFLGFIAVVQPHTRVLNVIPVSGLREVTVNHASEPLYQAVSDSKPRTATRLVSEATGVPIDHYFYLTSSDLNLILQALYYHSPNWPKDRTPLTMLQTLGYPYGRIVPNEEMKLMGLIVNHLPLIDPVAATKLLAIPTNSTTNLTSYQLYLLAGYVRGDQLHRESARQYVRQTRRSHG